MSVSYDVFTDAFLSKITDFEMFRLDDETRTSTVDGYMKRALSAFSHICSYDFDQTGNDDLREFSIDIPDGELVEMSDIVSEGMLVQWLKLHTYKQELLENALNTRDFTTYSPAELLLRIGNAYAEAQKNFTQMIREYSYNHGNLTELHL